MVTGGRGAIVDHDDVLTAALARAAALAAQDEAALRRLMHPEFVWTSHRGHRLDLEAYLEANCRGSLTWHSQRLVDPSVVVVGDTAVISSEVVDDVDPGSGIIRFTMPMTQTWVRVDRAWLLLAGHAGPRLG